jgi:murein DD-endopeptidase MepM/ murein hydrolase activator NlpD
MTNKQSFSSIVVVMFAVVLGACQPTANTPQSTPTQNPETIVQAYTPFPTAEIVLSPTSTATTSATATTTNTATPSPTTTPRSTRTPTSQPSPIASATLEPTQQLATLQSSEVVTILQPGVFLRVDSYVFERPIVMAENRQDWVARVYPYGGTQFGQFDVHLGVDMQNPRFTPIVAVADGVVVYAGDDLSTAYGPYTDYYGNLVIIEHPDIITLEGLPVYTLYGHMQEIDVEIGQTISAGQEIGSVGDTGIALGPHLHFEVRMGDFTNYRNTRNPELFIKPYRGFGTLVGSLINDSTLGTTQGVTILLRNSSFSRETYTYGGDRVNSSPIWGENFTLGDIPEGTYDVIVSDRNGRVYDREEVTITAGQSTWVELNVNWDNAQ